MQFWLLGGEATLNLTTSGGTAKVEFNCTLGQPGAPHSLTPSSAPFAHSLPPLLTDPVTVVPPREKETVSEQPTTRQLGLKQLLPF